MMAATSVPLLLLTAVVVIGYAAGQLCESNVTTFVFESFDCLSDRHLKCTGDCVSTSDGTLNLTSYDMRSWGRVMYVPGIRLMDPVTSQVAFFSTNFTFSMKADYSRPGEGLGFVMQANPEYQGHSGGFLGLYNKDGKAGTPTVAIEFDTYRDWFYGFFLYNDINSNHVGVDIESINSKIQADAGSVGIDLGKERSVTAWIDYIPSSDNSDGNLQVRISTDPIRPRLPLITYNVDLSKHISEVMYLGFSATTGDHMVTSDCLSYHNILSWSFDSWGIGPNSPPPPPILPPPPASVLPPIPLPPEPPTPSPSPLLPPPSPALPPLTPDSPSLLPSDLSPPTPAAAPFSSPSPSPSPSETPAPSSGLSPPVPIFPPSPSLPPASSPDSPVPVPSPDNPTPPIPEVPAPSLAPIPPPAISPPPPQEPSLAPESIPPLYPGPAPSSSVSPHPPLSPAPSPSSYVSPAPTPASSPSPSPSPVPSPSTPCPNSTVTPSSEPPSPTLAPTSLPAPASSPASTPTPSRAPSPTTPCPNSTVSPSSERVSPTPSPTSHPVPAPSPSSSPVPAPTPGYLDATRPMAASIGGFALLLSGYALVVYNRVRSELGDERHIHRRLGYLADQTMIGMWPPTR